MKMGNYKKNGLHVNHGKGEEHRSIGDDENRRSEADGSATDPVSLIGTEILFDAVISAPKPATNPRCFDYRT